MEAVQFLDGFFVALARNSSYNRTKRCTGDEFALHIDRTRSKKVRRVFTSKRGNPATLIAHFGAGVMLVGGSVIIGQQPSDTTIGTVVLLVMIAGAVAVLATNVYAFVTDSFTVVVTDELLEGRSTFGSWTRIPLAEIRELYWPRWLSSRVTVMAIGGRYIGVPLDMDGLGDLLEEIIRRAPSLQSVELRDLASSEHWQKEPDWQLLRKEKGVT